MLPLSPYSSLPALAGAPPPVPKFPQSSVAPCSVIHDENYMKLPVISGNSPTVRDHLIDQQEIYLVDRANGAALAKGIKHLKQDSLLRQTIAEQGFKRFKSGHTIKALGAQFKRHLKEVAS